MKGVQTLKLYLPLLISCLIGILGAASRPINIAVAADDSPVRIVEEEGPTGHKTIGIEEKTVGQEPGSVIRLTFATLMDWKFQSENPKAPPKNVQRLDGKRVELVGFMFPLQEGKEIRYFCSLRTTQTCCYGPRPEYNQYVFVEMNEPTDFFRLKPVQCSGVFRVEPNPDEGYIYRLEGKQCVPMDMR
jgi:hypothetical protein